MENNIVKDLSLEYAQLGALYWALKAEYEIIAEAEAKRDAEAAHLFAENETLREHLAAVLSEVYSSGIAWDNTVIEEALNYIANSR